MRFREDRRWFSDSQGPYATTTPRCTRIIYSFYGIFEKQHARSISNGIFDIGLEPGRIESTPPLGIVRVYYLLALECFGATTTVPKKDGKRRLGDALVAQREPIEGEWSIEQCHIGSCL